MITVPQITASATCHGLTPTARCLIAKTAAAAQNKVINMKLARNQQAIPISVPAIRKVRILGFRNALASKNTASKIGSTEIASGNNSTEFHASWGENAAKRAATTPALSGRNSATMRKISTSEKASSAICTNWTAAADSLKEWMVAISS